MKQLKSPIVISRILFIAFVINITNVQAQTYSNVVYASKSSSNKLDIYIPSTGTRPFPTIVIIHGGGFSGGDKGPESRYANAMVSRGFVVACMNYRLSSEAIFPAQIYDVKAAIRFLKAHASTYSMDTSKFATWGESAGGGLAALAGTSCGDSIVEDLTMGNSNYNSNVKAVVDFSGCIDFLTMNKQWTELGVTNGLDYDTSTSYASILVGGAIQTKKDLCNEFNAETYITTDDGYFWLEHGTADNTIPYLQSKVFADSLRKVIPSGRVSLHIIAGAGHVDDKFFTDSNLDSIANFLNSCFSTTNIKIDEVEQTKFGFLRNYPNPFNPSTTISFELPKESFVNLEVFNLLGKHVVTLVQERRSAGRYSVTFNASGISSGVYFYKMTADNFIAIKKLVLIK